MRRPVATFLLFAGIGAGHACAPSPAPVVVTALVTAPASPPAPPAAPAPALSAALVVAPTAATIRRHVVLVSIDGLKPEYYTHADTYHLAIPTLRGLMQRGRYAEGVQGTWPTVTYPAHTTLVTGARPSKHGILANRPFDPTYKNQAGWNWYAESIKADTLWAAARRAGKTTGSVYWPVTVGAAIDDDFPQMWRAKADEDDKLLRSLMPPGLADTFTREYGALPAEHRTDHERGNAAEFLVREKRHDLTLVYFTDLDDAQHAYGPGSREVFRTLEKIDTELGRVVSGVEAAGDTGRTAVIVVSDHGFAKVSSVVHPAVLLRQAGLIEVVAGTVKSWRAGVLAAGGLAAIYLKDPNDAALNERVARLLDEAAGDPNNGIQAVHRPEVSLREGGFAGSSFVLEATPGYEFDGALSDRLTGPSTDKGAHGYPPENPEMFASLIAAGDGIRSGPPLPHVAMVGIAPTVARLLGLTLRDAETGPIRELLAEP